MSHPVDHRIPHIDVGRGHIDLGPQHLLAVLVHAVLHILKQHKVLLHTAVTVGALLPRFRQCPTVFTDLLCGQVTDKCLALLDQLYRRLVHLVKIIGSKEQTILPVCSQPLDILLDGLHEFHLLLGGVRIVETHIKLAAVFLGQAVIQQYRLGMSDMQISVGFRRETCPHGLTMSLR